MGRYQIAISFLLASCKKLFLTSAVNYKECGNIEDIGTRNLERFNYSVDMTTKKVDDDSGNQVCSYRLDLNFKHDDTLPIPDNPVEQCTPGPNAPMASDGLPYYAFRWYYEQVPENIKKVTGIDNISIDFNPCGHPPLGVFTLPHYDIHYYTIDSETRSCMVCEKAFPTPVCDPENQISENGKAFFEAQIVPQTVTGGKTETINDKSSYELANMPAGFQLGLNDMVPFMGGHAWDVTKQPTDESPWTEPFWLMGSYDGNLAFYETMVPYLFVSGDKDTYFEEEMTYIGQTIDYLPFTHSVSYDAESKLITFSLKGNSNCDQFDDSSDGGNTVDTEGEKPRGDETKDNEEKEETKDNKEEEETSGKSSVTFSTSLFISLAALYFVL